MERSVTLTIAQITIKYIYTLFRQSEAAHNRYENDITDLN